MKTLRNNKGFTLIELIIVIIILGILAAVAIPKYTQIRRDAADATAQGFLGSLRGANSIVFAQRNISGAGNYSMTDVFNTVNVQGMSILGPTDTTVILNIPAEGTYVFGMVTLPNMPTTAAGINCLTAAVNDTTRCAAW